MNLPNHPDGGVPERLDALCSALGLAEPSAADESSPPVRVDLVRAFVRDELRGDWPEVVGDLVVRFRPWRRAYQRLLVEAVTGPPTHPPPFEGPRDEPDTTA